MPGLLSADPASELPQYGIDSKSDAVRWLRPDPSPELIDYLDLIEPHGPNAGQLVSPDGVVENQKRPLLYFVNQARLSESENERQQQLQILRRSLACRGDRAYLAIVRPGTLDVMPVSLKDKTPEWTQYNAGTTEATTFFSRLALGTSEGLPKGGEVDYLFKEIFALVDHAATQLARLNIKRSDVISLVGRVLFFRFLRDRDIVKESNLSKIAPGAKSLANCFENAENTAATCHWLDKTFNGDFLPLTDDGSLEFFVSRGKNTGQKLFHHLSNFVQGEEPSAGDSYQGRLNLGASKFDWGHLDFAHIPVGLLSQVYEKLSWKWNRKISKSRSVHYTPRNIASVLVGEAFDNLPEAHAAKVLDPACGASVFLVIAFRRIYRELWQHTGKRPDTKAIRRILENQLVGFDVCDSALKLSALSLYLTAIELDPDPVPPEKLKFKALIDASKTKKPILFDWRRDRDNSTGPVVGSIGAHVGDRFHAKFDLVLCNPPWTNIGSKYKPVSEELDTVSRAIVSSLDPEVGKSYKNPDSVPDLPFIWRSMQWCKPEGRIAMALPARTLFKQGPMAEVTRKALFRLLEVNGIINCSNLRKTAVWPDMNQPFMLLFARNRRPKPHHRLHFISPHTDLHANSIGEMRIDEKSAQLVDVDQSIEEPWLWKALAVGTVLDIEVVRKIKAAGAREFNAHWVKDLSLECSQGYQIAEEQAEQKEASALHGLLDLKSSPDDQFLVDPGKLQKFERKTLFRTRLKATKPDPLCVFRGPLALISVSPGDDRTQGRALLCCNDVAYSESYYGYSANGQEEAGLLVKYVQLWVHCDLLMFFALMTSAEIGVERPKFQKRDLDRFPFIPWTKLSKADKKTVRALSKRLIDIDISVFPDIDAFFGRLYGLNSRDLEVMNDTLEVREPSDELGTRASKRPAKSERGRFCRRLASHVRPLFKVLGKLPEIQIWKPSESLDSPFVVFTVTVKGEPIPEPSDLFRESVLPLAHETGATLIIKEIDGGLLVALLGQYRYWTPSRARLLGAEIIRNHMTIFEE